MRLAGRAFPWAAVRAPAAMACAVGLLLLDLLGFATAFVVYSVVMEGLLVMAQDLVGALVRALVA